MVQQADSIHTGLEIEAELQQQSVQQKHSSQLTPKQVLSWLPKNATPAQQDSMIRAHIKPVRLLTGAGCPIPCICLDIRQAKVSEM